MWFRVIFFSLVFAVTCGVSHAQTATAAHSGASLTLVVAKREKVGLNWAITISLSGQGAEPLRLIGSIDGQVLLSYWSGPLPESEQTKIIHINPGPTGKWVNLIAEVKHWNGTAYGAQSTPFFLPPLDCTEQTIVVEPMTATMKVGESKIFNLAGAHVMPYQFSVVSGIGGLVGTDDELVFQATQAGTVTFKVWANASEQGASPFYCPAEPVTVTVTVEVEGKKVTVSLDNSKSTEATTFHFFQNGEQFTTRTVEAGKKEIVTVSVPGEGPVTVTAPTDYTINGPGGIRVRNPEGTITHENVATVTPTGASSPPPANPPSASPPPGYTPPLNPPPKAPDDPTPPPPTKPKPPGSVWNAPNAGGTGAATNDVVAEGSTKVVEAVDKVRLLIEQMNERDSRDGGKWVKDPATGEWLWNGPGASAEATTLAQAQAAASAADEYTGTVPTGSPNTQVVGTAPGTLLTLEIAQGKTVTVSWLPAGSMWSGASGVLSGARTLLVWAAVMWFIWSCGRTLDSYLQALPHVQAADAAVGVENAVPGVSQGKTWGAAALLVGATVVASGTMVGLVHSYAYSHGYGISSIFNAVNFASIAGAVGLMEDYIPFSVLINLYLFRVGFSYLCAPVYMAASGVMRFMKA